MIPAFRALTPSYASRIGDLSAPHVLVFRDDHEAVLHAAETAGAASERLPQGVRVVGHLDLIRRLAAALEAAGHPAAGRLRRFLAPPASWQLRTRALPLDRPGIMAILNLTNDSFSGDGVGADVDQAIRRAEELRAQGADLIDVGAESARADRPAQEEREEAAVVATVFRALAREGHVLSVDTYKGLVAAAALNEGAELVNDISGLTVGTAAAVEAARTGAGYVLNYSYSPPKHRPDPAPVRDDVVLDMLSWFEERIELLRSEGLDDSRLAIDPGIAFGKSHDEDLQVLRRVGEFRSEGLPLLLAHSRKNFIGSITGLPASARDPETHVVTAMAYAEGVRVFRVHDVAGTRRALAVAAAIADGAPGDFAPDGASWPWRAGAESAHAEGAGASWAAPSGQRW